MEQNPNRHPLPGKIARPAPIMAMHSS
jgi:hypothetical protein